MDPILERYHALEEKVLAYNPSADTALLYRAFQYADQAHSKQIRKDGSPYITHPLAVADIVADLKLDEESLLAALLHDCIEDTNSTWDDIARLFGPSVADLVEGVSKLTRVKYNSLAEKQMENLRKMLMAMSKDIRVILVKLCDRLHNMRTMQYQTPSKQQEKSLETAEIYAPIAHRLGMQSLKWELEDLSLKYLNPVCYNDVETQLNARYSHHQEFLRATHDRILSRMMQEGIECKITSRIKHIYSIYRKMYTQHKSLDEIFDLYALRIIVTNISDCYNALGHIHDMYNPVPGRFKDYISTPKPNGYQSLHTTVIGREAIPFEVQIRTEEMHQIAEYGIAAHWKYKQGYANSSTENEKAYEWVRKLLESQDTTDAEEFVKSLKVDLFSDQVFVFTPKGDVRGLPAGSTPIDYAYSIHSAIGNSMVGAKVNGRIVTYGTQLQNGDIVEIMTSKSAKGPSRDWQKMCKSNEAKNKIRQWLKKERRSDNIVTGRSSFESELKREGFTLTQITDQDTLPRILKKVQFSSLDDMYAAIGYGGLTAAKAVSRIKSELTSILREQRAQDDALVEEKEREIHVKTSLPANGLTIPEKKMTHSKNGIIVEGIDNCLVKFAKCCTPVPGDPIIGYITKGYGVSVHRQDCPNASPEKRVSGQGRWIAVSWGASEQEVYSTTVEISAKDRTNLFLDVAACLSAAKVRVDSLIANGMPDGYAIITAKLSIRDRYELDSVMRKLNNLSGVMAVRRAKG